MTSATPLPRPVHVLSAVAFFVAAGFGIVAPAIPVFARSFGVSRAAAALVLSAFAIMRLVSALGVGKLVNILGGRIVLGTGIGIVAASSALAGFSHSYWQLLVLRGAGGVGSAMFSVSAISVLLGSISPEQRGQAIGRFSGGFLLGGIAAPLLGGYITQVSLRAPFFLYAGTLAAAGAVGLALLPRHRRTPRGGTPDAPAEAAMTLGAALRRPAFRAAAAANLADSWAAIGVRSAMVPLFVLEVLHRTPLWTGIGFTVFTGANVLTLWLGGRFVDRVGRKPALLAGTLGSAIGVGLLLLPAGLGPYLLSMLVFGLGSGLLDVAPGAVLGDVAGNRGGTVIAGYQMAGDVGGLVGPLLAGLLADHFGYDAAFGSAVIILLVATAVVLPAPETLHRRQGDSA